MFDLKIRDVPVLFIQAFTASDAQAILQFVRSVSGNRNTNRVLFVDTPMAPNTVQAVRLLQEDGFDVTFRDHHGLDGEPTNDNERRVHRDIEKMRSSLKEKCNITVRRLHPGCSTLVEVGEFADAAAIIADPDADGLTAAAKAAGVWYPELDADAAILDGEPFLQTTGSYKSQLLAKGIAVLPSFDYRKPREREDAKQKLFSRWIDAVNGNETALKALEESEAAFDEAVAIAKRLAADIKEVAPGVVLADAFDAPIYDVGTLTHLLEQQPGCRVTVVRKALGPIAAIHGVQYSMSVPKILQDQIDLRKFVPQDVKPDPTRGIISNVSFLLHVSDQIWNDFVLPALQDLNLAPATGSISKIVE